MWIHTYNVCMYMYTEILLCLLKQRRRRRRRRRRRSRSAEVPCSKFVIEHKPTYLHTVYNLYSYMGFFRSAFSFTLGTVVGVFVAQNYDVPNVQKLYHTALSMVRQVEESHRKDPKKKSDDEWPLLCLISSFSLSLLLIFCFSIL